MNKRLDLLSDDFRSKVRTLLNNCLDKGVIMFPGETLRDPFLQAKYWRRSRTEGEARTEIDRLKELGATFLAQCIEKAGPQAGKLATNAIPGLSWHQWGEAVDCCWLVNGRPVWDLTSVVNNINGYDIYGEEAKLLGLDCGLYWESFVDAPHVQFRPSARPSDFFSILEINNEMKRVFGRRFIFF
jgi:peptidoglycan LD-endopeptidase CwlK